MGWGGEAPAVAGACGLDSATGEFWLHGDLGGLFGFMFFTGFLGGKQPGSDPAFWEKACGAGRARACRSGPVPGRGVPAQLRQRLFHSGTLLSGGKGLPRIRSGRRGVLSKPAISASRAPASALSNMVKTDGDNVLLQPCNRGDGAAVSCSGRSITGARESPQPGVFGKPLPAKLYGRIYARLRRAGGKLSFWGRLPKDIAKARQIPKTPAMRAMGGVLQRWHHAAGGDRNAENEPLPARFHQGCDLGYPNACAAL